MSLYLIYIDFITVTSCYPLSGISQWAKFTDRNLQIIFRPSADIQFSYLLKPHKIWETRRDIGFIRRRFLKVNVITSSVSETYLSLIS